MENGRVVLDGTPDRLAANADVQEFYLGGAGAGGARQHARCEALQTAQAVAVVTALLEVRNVSRSFGGLRAVQDVSFTVEQGTICALIGPNGAGKTTLFNLISAVLRPDTGRIRFEGATSRAPTHRLAGMGIARTFQNLAVFRQESVVRNILAGMHAHLRTGLLAAAVFVFRARAEESRARERAEEIIEFLEIETSAIARRRPVLRLAEACRTRPRPGDAPAPAAAGRDGVRHEPGGTRGHRPLRARPEGRTRHDRADDRARHGHRDGHFRPCLRAASRPPDRGRNAGRGRRRSGGDRRLSRRQRAA